ncbi:hypothetical protein SLEP1_g39153 [Rubroshorea leprosula]|uniref:Uncharacterized protein n=1 Tax=Rubroshorea leprosula TaxID=152421 RepID=A0AAV5KZJ8_9ROSI|nr:hypothetical protein SLEP1_g39153 [Rubroshorea leprosula]
MGFAWNPAGLDQNKEDHGNLHRNPSSNNCRWLGFSCGMSSSWGNRSCTSKLIGMIPKLSFD